MWQAWEFLICVIPLCVTAVVLLEVNISTCEPLCVFLPWLRLSTHASQLLRQFFQGCGGGGGSRRLNQLTCFLPCRLPAWPHVQWCLSDVRLWCLYRNNLVLRCSCVLGALEATQRKYLWGVKVSSMVFTCATEKRCWHSCILKRVRKNLSFLKSFLCAFAFI